MRRLLACLIVFAASPAVADTTAVYESPDKRFRMTVEIADNGDLRGDVAAKPGVYFLTLDGQGYVVQPTPDGQVVERVEDLGEALRVVMAERMPGFEDLLTAIGGLPDRPYFVKGGEVTVQGRTGTAYYSADAKPTGAPTPVAVISADPELAPLGAAMAGQFELSERLQIVKIHNPFNDQMKVILRSGAPLSFAGAELTTVSHDPIASERFTLPGPVASREAVIKRVRSTATGTSVKAF